ncbi:uncharacterized protein LOC135371021 [Ornithodoros turicata]|uniref:Putative ubiquinone oxidoreductase ndufb6/b17 subunit n=1 Tax=Ornithodoros turicata TaxID=34597 RepID=A0A2R5LI12_9ACAR
MSNEKLPHSHTGGVRPMNIQGRFGSEIARVSSGEFSQADREWRKKWVNDQVLSPNEPRRVPELERKFKNPIRRFYRFPMDYLFSKLEPHVGRTQASVMRWVVPKLFFVYLGAMAFHYQVKYNSHDWTRHSGFIVRSSRKDVLPGDPGYPDTSDRSAPQDYADHGFKDRKVFLS